MVFPAAKLLAAGWVWARVDAASGGGHRAVRLMEALGRWSMIDVFVAALIVVAVKVSLVADVGVHSGIYVFAAAAALSIALMAWIGRALQARRGGCLTRRRAGSRPRCPPPGSDWRRRR